MNPIETLIKRNLHEVFGERDAKKRREAIAQLWTEDCDSIVRLRYCISDSRTTCSVSFSLSIYSTKVGAWLGALDDRASRLSRA